jgi:hypothetical protein
VKMSKMDKSKKARQESINLSSGLSEDKDEFSLEEINAVHNLIMEGDEVDQMLIAEYNRKQSRQRLLTQ